MNYPTVTSQIRDMIYLKDGKTPKLYLEIEHDEVKRTTVEQAKKICDQHGSADSIDLFQFIWLAMVGMNMHNEADEFAQYWKEKHPAPNPTECAMDCMSGCEEELANLPCLAMEEGWFDIAKIIGKYINLNSSEEAGCPFCKAGSKGRFLKIHRTNDGDIFKCEKCGKGGDVVEFVRLYERLSTRLMAVAKLAEHGG